jgi:hypothetical protein
MKRASTTVFLKISRCTPMLNACTDGSCSLSFIVWMPVVPKVKSDCGQTS